MKLYLADKDDSWNEQRLLVLATAMEKYLLPHMKEEVDWQIQIMMCKVLRVMYM